MPTHYKAAALSSVAMKTDFPCHERPPVPHFKQEIIYSVHLEKLSTDKKAGKCGEEKHCIFQLLGGSRISCNAAFREKKRKAVGSEQPFKVNAEMLAFSKQKHTAYKEKILYCSGFWLRRCTHNAYR